MKKVTLLGDSILVGCEPKIHGYGLTVRKILGDDYDVYIPDDNCRFAQYTMRLLFDKRDFIRGSDIIHWNNGLWNVGRVMLDGEQFTDVDEYVKEMVRLGKELKKLAPRVIFSTITPVRDEKEHIFNADIMAFNAAVVPALREIGIEINDLFPLLYDRREELIRSDDNIHLTDEAVNILAKSVADVIRKG